MGRMSMDMTEKHGYSLYQTGRYSTHGRTSALKNRFYASFHGGHCPETGPKALTEILGSRRTALAGRRDVEFLWKQAEILRILPRLARLHMAS